MHGHNAATAITGGVLIVVAAAGGNTAGPPPVIPDDGSMYANEIRIRYCRTAPAPKLL